MWDQQGRDQVNISFVCVENPLSLLLLVVECEETAHERLLHLENFISLFSPF